VLGSSTTLTPGKPDRACLHPQMTAPSISLTLNHEQSIPLSWVQRRRRTWRPRR
jgi:hypothetical protein